MDQYRYKYTHFDGTELSTGSTILPEDYNFVDYVTQGSECCAEYDGADKTCYVLDLNGNRTGEYTTITNIEKL